MRLSHVIYVGPTGQDNTHTHTPLQKQHHHHLDRLMTCDPLKSRSSETTAAVFCWRKNIVLTCSSKGVCCSSSVDER